MGRPARDGVTGAILKPEPRSFETGADERGTPAKLYAPEPESLFLDASESVSA